MKKLLCILLAVMVFLSSSACTQESKVTVYIPESVAVNGPNGESTGVISYLFEEGWQTKKTFTLTYGGNTDVLGQNVPVMTYSDKCLVISRCSNKQIICMSSAVVSSIPAIPIRPCFFATFMKVSQLPQVLWSVSATILSPLRAAIPAILFGVISSSPQGERQE